MSVSDRLGRLLFIVPYVAHRDGVPIKELAQKTGTTPGQIAADLDLLSMVGQPPLTPDHLIDLYVEDDVVYVDLDQSLSRPLRLTHEEARALVLGAKLVGSLGGLGLELEKVLDKILAVLNPVDREIVQSLSERVGVWQDTQEVAQPVVHLRQAIDEHREVGIEYYSLSSDRQKTYRLQPLALINHSGVEYLVALDVDAEQHEKLFRLDRMAAVEMQTMNFEPPANLDLERFRTQRLYFGQNTSRAEVRFSRAVAGEVSERFADSETEAESAGSIRVRLSTSSPAWLARWVLPFGVEAEVVSPEEQREYLGRLCAEAAEAYGRQP
ncbi:helix-turn-helix transcriptional regulator [Myxococcota bacterium]